MAARLCRCADPELCVLPASVTVLLTSVADLAVAEQKQQQGKMLLAQTKALHVFTAGNLQREGVGYWISTSRVPSF